LLGGLVHRDLEHLLPEAEHILIEDFVMLKHRALDQRCDLVLGYVVPEDEVPVGLSCALEHQHAFAKRCADLIHHDDNAV
jgi:hypothetical protein